MSRATTLPNVLTIEEAAKYLRLSRLKVQQLAAQGELPGREIEREWRFLKAALDDWLRGPDARTRLLRQASALADDESLADLRRRVYASRGRPETAERSGR